MRRPVKAGCVRRAAGTRLLARGLRETGEASAEAVVGGRHAVRLKRPAPAVECVPEATEHLLLATGAACCVHLVIVAVLLEALVFARADGYGDTLLSEDGGDLQVPAECLDVGAQRREVDVAAALQA